MAPSSRLTRIPATKDRLGSVACHVVQRTFLNVYCVSKVFGSTRVTLTSIASLPSAISKLQVIGAHLAL